MNENTAARIADNLGRIADSLERIVEGDCPHCNGCGQTQINGDFHDCYLCKGEGMVLFQRLFKLIEPVESD